MNHYLLLSTIGVNEDCMCKVLGWENCFHIACLISRSAMLFIVPFPSPFDELKSICRTVNGVSEREAYAVKKQIKWQPSRLKGRRSK